MTIKKEYLGQRVTKNGVTVEVKLSNVAILRRLGINHVFNKPEKPKAAMVKIEKVEPREEEAPSKKMTVTELRAIAKDRGIGEYSTLTKKELLNALLSTGL